jgi:hypothetical protein
VTPVPVEIRPVPPSGGENPADRTALSKWLLRADPDAGTLTLTEDRPLLILPTRTVAFSLPSTGRSDAVHAVCLADYRWVKNLQTGITWRLLFLDGDGRTLGQGRMRDEPKASQMWPISLFKPLEPFGISVTQEQFATEKAFKQAHPAA